MSIRAILCAALLVLMACTTSTPRDDPTTGLTIGGPSKSVDALLRSAGAAPHKWSVERRWSQGGGLEAIRLKWPDRPGPGEVGSIVALVQAARANGLTVSDTQIVETQP